MKARLSFLLLICCRALASDSPSSASLAGDGTTAHRGREAFSQPLTNLSRTNRRVFVVGNSFFKESWVAAPATPANRDGLGPLFHGRSCSACHVNDGRGAPPAGDEVMTGLLLRLSVFDSTGKAVPHPVYGAQLAVRSLAGVPPEAEVTVKWIESGELLSDGETVNLRRPEFTFTHWHYGEPGPGLLFSPRLAPPVIGGGLLEAVPEAALAALADPEDKNADGISGRLHRLPGGAVGRFGWKASVATLRQQAAEAFAGDLGITSAEHPAENHTPAQTAAAAFPDGGKPEADSMVMDRMESYLRGLSVPARRSMDDPMVKQGGELFLKLNCAACHTPEFRTGDDHPLPELRSQTIRPFTDLLLHDMGADLADGRPDADASGTEWRTPPLWGLGLNAVVNGNAFYLHDGRARTLPEAILWHGGEALAARDAFKALPPAERTALLRFLESL